MTRLLPAIAATTLLIGGGALYLNSQAGSDVLPLAAQAQEADAQGDQAEAGAESVEITEMTMGNPDADVQVIEYASFTCPHCQSFHETVFPDLKADYIDTDKIEFVYREVYFDRPGLWASMVARCGGEMRFFGIVDMLYDNQRDWVQGEPAEIADNLRGIGRKAGLNNEQLDACLTDGAKAQELVSWFEQNAEENGIESTPSFVINGETYSNMSYEDFSGILDEQLGE
ncbi:Protein-disulfide isomerase [Tranquillimonas rosea]|uniref:Protein-disulfide isomerase n=1 Tax=Tranquillimonas rosea TaxID=641238 RepID=A0A1H9W3B3_9RHOB|nr:DsbA family protein [Tranquillimonas rosea]SES28231.1 Protein-disulfide isomerase [Tranquillimonas rosea]